MTTILQYIREGLASGQQVFRRSVLEKLVEELDSSPAPSIRVDGTKNLDYAVYENKITELTALLRNTEKRLAEAERNLSIERKRVFDLQRKSRQITSS
jgi:prophage antirepressor-like protein